MSYRGLSPVSSHPRAPAPAINSNWKRIWRAYAALGATRAGVDLLLFARTYEGADRAARALTDALRSGRVDRGALETSLARVLALRAALP